MNINEIIGIRIKEYRQRLGISQEELAFKIDKSVKTLDRIEKGLFKRLTLFLLFDIVQALNCDFDEFIKRIDN